METKQSIRKQIFRLRKEAAPDQIRDMSNTIMQKVMALDAWKNAEWIFAYMDCKNEVMTGSLIEEAWHQKKRTAVPRVQGNDLVFYEITSMQQCESGYFGISEPLTTLPAASCEHALLLVPGVAFDTSLHRVGYGKGFYDRYLSVHPGHTKVAVAFSWQVFGEVPFDDTDINPDFLITENDIYKTKM